MSPCSAAAHTSTGLEGATRYYDDGGSTVSVLESCTAGLVMSALTTEPGTGFLLGGLVCYDAAIKTRFGVPAELIERHGVVSAEVAVAMAVRARQLFGSDIGMGITGEAGPIAEERPVGLVYIASVRQQDPLLVELHCQGDRGEIRWHAVHEAGRLLERCGTRE